MYDTKKYLHIGQLTAILLLQGGQGLPIFNHSVAHYIIYEKITNCHEDLPKNMRKAFDQLKDMSNNQISRCIDDLLPNRFEEGYSVPSCKIEQSHLPRIIQAMVAHHIIQPQKMILDQFLQGLQIGGLLEVLRSHQKESYSLFKGSDVHLTADVFENMLKFKYDMIIPGSNNMAIAQAIEQGCFLLLQAAESGEAKFLVDETSLNVTLSSILKWLTGATRIPAVGLDSKIEVLFDPTAVLPRVNTCSLQLYMPLLSKFSDPEMVMKTIAEWITNSVGFGLV
ncbi:uncharacterized protein LOC134719802 [Mytilus trossulus]|uniref:uncharacterized protein LOC134719802 n=1 Tax=Mytilus trossulus TaxID=6551 RepID=UPI0030046BC1